MKKRKGMIFFALLMAGLLLLAACAQTAAVKTETDGKQPEKQLSEKETEPPETTPLFGEFTTKDSNGDEVTQAIFSGHKLTMVNIWATFCGPCLREMPELGELDREYRDKGFQIVGMPTDVMDRDGTIYQEQVDLVNEIAEKTGAEYPHLLPSRELIDAKLGSVTAVPETVFVDENGNQVGESYRGARSKDAWAEIIDGLLASMPDTAAQVQTQGAVAAEPAAAEASADVLDAPLFYQFETQGLDGKTYTDEVLNQNANQQLTLALVWNPDWEGSGEALRKLQAYLETDATIEGIGFVLGAEGKEQEALEIAGQAGAEFPQLLPAQGIEDYILKEEPQLIAIAPWGTIVDKPFDASGDMEAWNKYIDNAVIDVNSGCCG